MSTLDFILSFATLFLTGTNVVTLVQLRSLRRKGEYEAESVQITNLQNIIHLNAEEIQRLADRLEAQEKKTDECGARCEERIEALQSQYETIVGSLRAAKVQGF